MRSVGILPLSTAVHLRLTSSLTDVRKQAVGLSYLIKYEGLCGINSTFIIIKLSINKYNYTHSKNQLKCYLLLFRYRSNACWDRMLWTI